MKSKQSARRTQKPYTWIDTHIILNWSKIDTGGVNPMMGSTSFIDCQQWSLISSLSSVLKYLIWRGTQQNGEHIANIQSAIRYAHASWSIFEYTYSYSPRHLLISQQKSPSMLCMNAIIRSDLATTPSTRPRIHPVRFIYRIDDSIKMTICLVV